MIRALHKKLTGLGLQYPSIQKKRLNPFFGYITSSVETSFELIIQIGKCKLQLFRDYFDNKRCWKIHQPGTGIAREICRDNIPDLDDILFKELKKRIFEIHGYDKSIEKTQKQIWTFLLSTQKYFPRDVRLMIAKNMWNKRFENAYRGG